MIGINVPGASALERSSSRAWDPKIVMVVTLVLVFLCGGAAGALVMDLRVHNRMRPALFDSTAGRALYFERLQKELNLTPAQSEQIQSVLNDFWLYYRTVLSDSKQRVEQLLNEEQKKKFEVYLQQQLPK